MIKIENTEVYGWESAIRGMRNPLNSHHNSDSHICDDSCKGCEHLNRECGDFYFGNNDWELANKLAKAGTDHSKFLRMINVTCDITAPLYWWKETDTYKVGTVANSESTMHCIHKKEFTIDDFSHDHLELNFYRICLENTIHCLNIAREEYLKTKDKTFWWQMIQLLPSSYNQKRTWQTNYQVLRNIYHSRKNHKLDEWQEFCTWVEGLPYSELITM